MKFDALLKDNLKKADLTPTELSHRARLSSRTVYRVVNEGATPERETVVRLALALRADPNEWLRIAGKRLLDAKELQRRREEFSAQRTTDESLTYGVSFLEKLKLLREEVSENNPRLMCVCYESRPAAIPRKEILTEVSDLIADGLYLAMFCPFPRVHEESTWSSWCARHYSENFGDVVGLAREYRASPSIKGKHEDRIRLYYPKARDSFIMPPATTFALRPTLIAKPDDSVQVEQMGVIAEVPYAPDDPRWFDMFKTFQSSESYLQRLIAAWRDYFLPAIATWSKQGWAQTDTHSESWELFDFSTTGPIAAQKVQ